MGVLPRAATPVLTSQQTVPAQVAHRPAGTPPGARPSGRPGSRTSPDHTHWICAGTICASESFSRFRFNARVPRRRWLHTDEPPALLARSDELTRRAIGRGGKESGPVVRVRRAFSTCERSGFGAACVVGDTDDSAAARHTGNWKSRWLSVVVGRIQPKRKCGRASGCQGGARELGHSMRCCALVRVRTVARYIYRRRPSISGTLLFRCSPPAAAASVHGGRLRCVATRHGFGDEHWVMVMKKVSVVRGR